MMPAAVLAVVVKTQGVGPTNAQLRSVQGNLMKADTAGMAFGKSMKKSGAMVSSAGKKMTKGVTLPLLAIGAAAADLELKFDRSMSLIQTQAGASARETKYLRREVLGLSQASKFGPDETAEALFRVRSAGFKGAKAMAVLREGTNLATVGNSNLEYTTKALTGAAKSLDLEGSKAFKHLAAEMNAAVGTGDMRMEELQDALSTGVLPAFVSAGLGFRDYASALTVMTDRNVPAQVASTRLRTAITMLVPHSKKAEEALGGIGIKAEDMAHIMRKEGLPAAIGFLAKHMDELDPSKANRIMIEAFGGAKSSATIETLVENWQEVYEKQKLVGEGVGKYNHQIKVAEENPLVELQKAWSSIQVDLINIGEVIVPIIVPAFLKVAHVIGDVVDKFDALSPGSQKAIVYIGLIVAAIGPFLRVTGWAIEKTGELIIWLERKGVALGADAAASEASAAANAELAASIAAVTEAESMRSVKMASGRTITWKNPAAAASALPASAPVAGEAEAAGAGAAGGLAGGLAAMLPVALAAVGVGNILSSVLGHDTKGAMFKTGGAAGGALIGGIVGSVVPGIGTIAGALVGGGIGSIAGGFIGKLFGGGDIDKFGKIQADVASQTDKLTDAVKRQQGAFANLAQASHSVKDAHQGVRKAQKEQTRAVKHLHADEKHLANVRNTEAGPAALRIRRDELKVKEASQGVTRAKHKEISAEHLHGARLRLSKLQLEQSVRAEKGVAEAQGRHAKQLSKLVKKEENKGASSQRIIHLLKTEVRAEESRQKALNSVKEAEQKAGTISQDFARKIKHIVSAQKEQAQISQSVLRKVEKQHPLVQGMGEWWTTSTKKATHGIKNVQNAMGPFQTQTHQSFQKAKHDANAWETTSDAGVDKVHKHLGNFAKSLGITGVGFGLTEPKKGGRKQRGGPMVVPGGGTGDTVPLVAHVEPGEVVHVLNSRASKDRKKLGALEQLNNEVPRFPSTAKFQQGGTLGGIGAAIAEANRINSAEFPYLWGGGHGSFSGPYDCSGAVSAILHAAGLLGRPMVSGELANFGAPGPGPITIYANGVHAFMKIAGKFFGTSGSNPGGGAGWFPFSVGSGEAAAGDSGGAFAVRHPTNIGGIEALKKVGFKGPPGYYTDTGKGVMKAANKMASSWAQKHMPGKWGGGDTAFTGPGKVVGASMYGGPSDPTSGTVGAAGISLPGTRSYAELGMGHNLGSLPFHSKLNIGYNGKNVVAEKLDIGLGGGDVEGHRRDIDLWYQTASALGFPGLGLVSIQKALKGGTLGLQKGGHADAKGKGKKSKGHGGTYDQIAKSVKNITKGVKSGKHEPKFKAALKKLHRKIEGTGLAQGRIDKMAELTKEVEKYSEYASNASSLTLTREEGDKTLTIQGEFRGGKEGEWLNKELSSILALRREVISAHNIIEKKHVPHVHTLLKGAKERLRAVRKAIRQAEQEKAEMEKKVKEIERAQSKNKTGIEAEIKTLEQEVTKEKNKKNPDPKRLSALREQIAAKKTGASSTDKSATDEIKKLKEQIRKNNTEQAGRKRVEVSLTSSPFGVIPSLETKQTGLFETMANLYGEGGEVKKSAFWGLGQIQGKGGPTDQIKGVPPIGQLGPEVLTIQQRLREIGEETEKKEVPEPNEEIMGIEKELGLELHKREAVERYQAKVMGAFPDIATTQKSAYLFAGAYAKGGVVMAEVGEKGPEIVAAPQGARVIPSHEARAALSGGGQSSLVIEELVVNTDGTVTVKTADDQFDAEVRKVTRKDTANSMASTPGGKGLRR